MKETKCRRRRGKVPFLEYIIEFGRSQGIFALPCEVADTYMNEASADELRVLLYVYRCGSPADTGRMARQLKITSEEAAQALRFWVEKGLFTCRPAGSAAAPARARAKKVIETPIAYTAEEIAQKAGGSEELRFVLETVPTLIGRLLSPSECSALINLYDGAGLPADVILMVVEYCVSAGKPNLRYMEKMALGWAEEGITTHELAENKIRELEARHSFEGQVRSITGVTGRALTPAEKQLVDRWSGWALSPELVRLAYEICASRTGKLSFSYMNSILKAWHEKGCRTPEQAKNEARQGGNGKSTSYNIEEYVDLSMKRLLKE